MLTAAPHPPRPAGANRQSGRSSGVEHNLAKVGVEGSNPFARSSFSKQNQYLTAQAEIDFLITRLKFGPA